MIKNTMRESKLSELFDMQMGKTPDRNNPEYWENGTHPWVSIADMTLNGKYIKHTKECITQKAVDETGIKPIYPGTAIMSFKLSVGKVARVITKCYSNEAIMAFEIPSVSVGEPMLINEYAYYLLQSLNFDNVGNKAVMGKTLNKAILRDTIVKYHVDIDKQSEIVVALDKVGELIDKRQQQLAKLDELVKARFVELFGDPLDNTKGLPVEPFANCCLDMHQGINTVADKVEYQPSGYPIIQSKNITKGFLDLDDVRYLTSKDYEKYREKYNPKVNDILICNIGTIGKSLVIKDEKNFLIAWNLFLVKLNLERVNPDYIKVFVEFLNDRHYYDQFLTGGTVKFVNKKTMGNIPVLMPSIEQQNQFSDFVKQTDKSKVAVQKALNEAQTLFDSLMQQYFG